MRRFYPQGEQAGSTKFYYTKDHLGSIREVMGANGTVVSSSRYDAWGVRTTVGAQDAASFGFTGHLEHKELGLVFTLYRAYDPATGRWLSRDPIGENGGINLYGYVVNSPVNYIDPLGLWQVTFGGGAGVGGLITFGYNSGQFNFGGFVGVGEGFFGSLDTSDSGCEKLGLSVGGRAVGEYGVSAFGGKRVLGISGDSGNAYMSNRNRNEPGLGLSWGNKQYGFGSSTNSDGIAFSGGLGAFVGIGATTVIGK
jgi:RHS repeat-associated protein